MGDTNTSKLVSAGIMLAHLDAIEHTLLSSGYYDAGRYGRLPLPGTTERIAAVREARNAIIAALPKE
jgi:hypothetical protein